MPYEKVKITGIRQHTKKETGEIFTFLEVKVTTSYSLLIGANHQPLIPIYRSNIDKEVILPSTWGIYRDKPALSISDDGIPFTVSESNLVPAPHFAEDKTDSDQSEKPAPASYFGKKSA